MGPSCHLSDTPRDNLTSSLFDHLRVLKLEDHNEVIVGDKVFGQLFVDFVDQVSDLLGEALGIRRFIALGSKLIKSDTEMYNTTHIIRGHFISATLSRINDGLEDANSEVKVYKGAYSEYF